jgi:hypothetical protein
VKPTILPLFLIILFLTFLILPSYSQSDLNLTVTTNRSAYYVEENVQIYGNLTLNNVIVTDGLVAIQVDDPRGTPIVIRTLTTGSTPQIAWYVYIGTVFASNQQGDPQLKFSKGELAYFNITVVNNDIQPRLTLVTINANDQNKVPIGSGSIKTTLPGLTYTRFIISIPIPADATLGTATAYANAYTEWPMLQGTPYCPERNATFNIVGAGGGTAATTTIQQTYSNYNLTFKLPTQIPKGTFTAYVTSIYQGVTAFNSTSFPVKMLGDVDGSGKVDWRDLNLLAKAYGTHQEDLNYNPEADFDRDGDVDWRDLNTLAKNYGKTA